MPLSKSATRKNGFVVGAAIGAGMVAKAAEQGGADFLLALSAGRYRMMGAPSIACMLPIGDNNALVRQFAGAEILERVALPVFFGACVYHPQLKLDALVAQIGEAGFAGICNFPPASHFNQSVRAVLEHAGTGFTREVALMRTAKASGLDTCAYVRRLDEALAMTDAGVDIICINYGWNAGGSSGVPSRYSLEEAGEHARHIFAEVRRHRRNVICTVEGGPITTPGEAQQVAETARADGYIGGSTIDRIPLETAVAESTSGYKSVAILEKRLQNLKSEWLGDGHPFGLIGRSAAMTETVRLIRKVAETEVSVLISGENGTGKELVAQAIHAMSQRSGRDMIAVNCAAIPRELVESELFGHEAGAFTGAIRRRIGRFEEASATTLLLDEIGELELPVQAKLLRVLEQGTFERLGSNVALHTNARVLCASNKPLRRMIAEGSFREDVFYRLSAVEITVAPLRERIEDLPLLVSHMLPRIAREMNPRVKELDASAYRVLMRHSWPGNVRELRNALERAAIMCEGTIITSADLPDFGGESPECIDMPDDRPMQPPQAAPPAKERDWIIEALRRNRFRRGTTAAELGIARKTLYNKMRRYKLI